MEWVEQDLQVTYNEGKMVQLSSSFSFSSFLSPFHKGMSSMSNFAMSKFADQKINGHKSLITKWT